MRIGWFPLSAATTPSLDTVVDLVINAERRGYSTVWLQSRGFDALTVFAVAGSRLRTIEVGTFVPPTYTRHPSVLAQQALSTQAAVGNRLALGIGLSHRVLMERGLGFDWSHPVRHMREYLSCLGPFLAGEAVTFHGQDFNIENYQIAALDAKPPSVLVAAIGPQMLKLTGQMADGTALWLGGAEYIRTSAVPVISEAAASAGRSAPRIVAGLPICVTDRAAEVRETAAATFERYGQLPSYRAALDKEGVGSPADVALIGNEREVSDGIHRLADAGATDLAAGIFTPSGEDEERTHALLKTFL